MTTKTRRCTWHICQKPPQENDTLCADHRKTQEAFKDIPIPSSTKAKKK